MPVYPDPNGGEMVVANRAEAEARGWTPSMGTFGVRSDPGAGGGGGGGMPAQTAPGLGGSQQAILDAFKASSGFSLQDLAERKRQFDATLEWQKQMWANQGMPELQIRQQAQALAQQEFEAQNAIAQQNLLLAQRSQGFQEEMGRAGLGLDYLKTAASMGGPADVFQAADFTRGVAQSGNAPAFLQALRNNTGLAAFNAPSGASPQALTPDVIAGRLTTGAIPAQTNPALQTIGGIAQAGGAALAPQAVEQLNPDELAALGSGFKKLGYSLPAFLSQYTQSRIGQGSAQAV